MTWTNLTLAPGWATMSSWPPARVRPLSGITGCAQIEAALSWSGVSTTDVPITNEASLPPGTYDTTIGHPVGGRCYNSVSAHVGTCEILVTPDGTLSVTEIPSGTAYLFAGEIYPTA